MENLRQLVDEEVISESQYKKALLGLFGPLNSSELELPKSPAGGVSLVVEP